MQVGADGVAGDRPLQARAAVVAVTAKDAAEGLLAGAEPGVPGVVLEAGQRRAPAPDPASPGRATSIATLPIRRGWSLRTVRTSSRETPTISSRAERVGVPEQLVAAAHAEDHRPASGGGVQARTLVGDQVRGA